MIRNYLREETEKAIHNAAYKIALEASLPLQETLALALDLTKYTLKAIDKFNDTLIDETNETLAYGKEASR